MYSTNQALAQQQLMPTTTEAQQHLKQSKSFEVHHVVWLLGRLHEEETNLSSRS